jgi:hypothetical protein
MQHPIPHRSAHGGYGSSRAFMCETDYASSAFDYLLVFWRCGKAINKRKKRK